MREEVIELMASVFSVGKAEIDGGVVFGKYPKWDSLKHMNLIVALEQEFNVTFDDEEVTDMLSLDLIIEIIETKKND
jgi:acyl carrier protein